MSGDLSCFENIQPCTDSKENQEQDKRQPSQRHPELSTTRKKEKGLAKQGEQTETNTEDKKRSVNRSTGRHYSELEYQELKRDIMVTRYTIDQILSRGNSSLPEASSPTLLSPTTPMHSPLWRPTSLDDPFKMTQPYPGGGRHREQRRDTMPPFTSESEEMNKRVEGREDMHPLARPVALRPSHGLGLPTRESPALEAFGLRPEGGYSGLEGGAYWLMLRQYMEAQYQLGGPRGLLPLHFQGFDPGVVAAAGSGRTRRRGGQVRFTAQQTRQLETWFSRHKYITPPQRKTIARELSLHEKQVKTWFQNRRAKWRKVQAQGGCEDGGAVSSLDVDVTAASPASSHDGSDNDPSEYSLGGEGASCLEDTTTLYN